MNHLRNTNRFITAVHRRMVLVKLLEHIGLCLLGSTFIALILMPLAIWQSMSTLPILISAVVLGVMVGASLTAYRWPTRQAAASEADRQLRLDDLLFTAVSVGDSNEDFAVAMRAMADAVCGRRSPSDVLFRRLGLRSWSAIGLAMSAAVTLAVIPFGASRSQAVDANASVLAGSSFEAQSGDGVRTLHGAQINPNNPVSEGTSDITTSGDQSSNQAANDGQTESAGLNAGYGNSTGTGSATSNAKPAADSQTKSVNPKKSSDSGTTSGGGTAAKNAMQIKDPSQGTEKAGGIGSAPAWHGDGAADQQTGATALVNIDRVPPQHRDLVRDFFSGQ